MSAFLRSLSRRALLVGAAIVISVPALAEDTIKFGLVAAMSGQSAKSGEAIMRGLSLAMDEINANGGVLGKKLELVVRDDESNPAKGVVAARELVQREKVAVLFGGLDTPVSMAIVPFANQSKVPFMGVWAAGTAITRNGAADNYVFRVSAVDALVDRALVDYAMKKYDIKKPGMILINNPWGESNEGGLKAALADPARLKIYHFARFDIAAIQHYLGVSATPAFCTKIASKLVRTYTDRHGLKDLVRELLGKDISKQQQSSDWGGAELSDAQKDYAASDVRYLHACHAILVDRLAREKRTELAQACFDFLPHRVALDLAGWPEHDIFSHEAP